MKIRYISLFHKGGRGSQCLKINFTLPQRGVSMSENELHLTTMDGVTKRGFSIWKYISPSTKWISISAAKFHFSTKVDSMYKINFTFPPRRSQYLRINFILSKRGSQLLVDNLNSATAMFFISSLTYPTVTEDSLVQEDLCEVSIMLQLRERARMVQWVK